MSIIGLLNVDVERPFIRTSLYTEMSVWRCADFSARATYMDVRFINPFLQATQNVFGTMVNTRVSLRSTMAVRGLVNDPNLVNAIVELHGEAEGIVILRFPSDVVLAVAEAFAGDRVNKEDAHDAIGELANMVAGNAKQNLYGRFATLSIPRVVEGDISSVLYALCSPWLTISFSSGVGAFDVAVYLEMKQELASAR